MDEFEAGQQGDLRTYLEVLSRRKWTILVTFVLVLGLALAYSFVKKPLYTATATVLVPEQQPNAALNNANSASNANSQTVQRLLADEQQFAKGDSVKNAAASALGYKPSVSVGMSSTDDVLTFGATSGIQAQAAAEANAYARAYITARLANDVQQYTEQVRALEQSIAALKAQQHGLAANNPQFAALAQSISTLSQSVEQAQAASQFGSAVGPSVVTAAPVPSSPSSPKPVKNGILGGLAGLVLGIGTGFLRERLDDRISSRAKAEAAAGGKPVVGLIPLVGSWRKKGSHHLALVEDSNSSVSEAYRTLRTAVQFLGIDRPRKVIAVTSSKANEGKSTLTANLAQSFARTGQKVVLVSTDLRRPRLHEFFGLDNETGLTSVLLGTVELAEALKPVAGENLSVMASGPVPPNPSEILSSERMKKIVTTLAEQADVVVLDCPPVLPVADSLVISRLADTVLVLASVPDVDTRELHRTCELLAQVDAPVAGLVLNRVPSGGWGAGYGYSNGYGYYDVGGYARKSSTGRSANELDLQREDALVARAPDSIVAKADGSPIAEEDGPALVQPPEADTAATSVESESPVSAPTQDESAPRPSDPVATAAAGVTDPPADAASEADPAPTAPTFLETLLSRQFGGAEAASDEPKMEAAEPGPTAAETPPVEIDEVVVPGAEPAPDDQKAAAPVRKKAARRPRTSESARATDSTEPDDSGNGSREKTSPEATGQRLEGPTQPRASRSNRGKETRQVREPDGEMRETTGPPPGNGLYAEPSWLPNATPLTTAGPNSNESPMDSEVFDDDHSANRSISPHAVPHPVSTDTPDDDFDRADFG